jgi:hypothetical protein
MSENETNPVPENDQTAPEDQTPDVEGYGQPEPAQASDPPTPGGGGGFALSDPPTPGGGGGNA